MTLERPILDRPMLGLSLMLGFCLLAPLGDSIAKTLGTSISLGLLVATRFGLQTLLLAPVMALSQRTIKMSRRVLVLTMVRTVLHILGIGTMFLALRYLPLADAIAIAFVMPFIMLVLGKTILHETIGIHRLAACGVGFAGTLLVIQPNFASVGAPALLPLGVALVFALFMLVTRQIAKEVDPISMQFVSGLAASAVLIPAVMLAPDGWSDLKPVWPSARDTALLGLMGAIGTLAHLLMTWSLRFAPSTTLAPMQYLEIPFATLIGWLVFADLPNGLAALGIAITVASGLYVIRREQLIQARPLLTSAPPAAE